MTLIQESTMRKSIKILIADDDGEFRKLISRKINENITFNFPIHLVENKPDISFATSAEETLTIIKNDQFDLLLLDILLGDNDGFFVCESIKRDTNYKNLPIIYITNYTHADKEIIKRCFDSGGQDYISKSSSDEEITSRIKCQIEIKLARERIMDLLCNTLPIPIAEELINTNSVESKIHELVHVLFTDFVGFSNLVNRFSTDEILEELDYCFKGFDNIIKKYNIEKIKTIGDSYMCVSHVPDSKLSDPKQITIAALEIQKFLNNRKNDPSRTNNLYFSARIGIHSGKVIAGVIGEQKLNFDIWGDTVNLAKRVEGACIPGEVCVSEITYNLIKNDYKCTFNKKLQIKNTEEYINVYLVDR